MSRTRTIPLVLAALLTVTLKESLAGQVGASHQAGEKTMTSISSHKALQIAYAAIADRPYSTRAGDIVVEQKHGQFGVTFVFLSDETRDVRGLDVAVSDAGLVLAVSDISSLEKWQTEPVSLLFRSFISAKKAYDIALAALKGFEEYDKRGRLTVDLHGGVYFVTFPLLHTPMQGSRAADYAVQVQLDARTGEVLKTLVAS
jgi:hypothetical protein